MKKRKNILFHALIGILLYYLMAFPPPLWAQNPLRGELDNGFKYIIHNTGEETSQVEMRLLFGVGSCMERDEERGFAHFLEHLAFAGSEHFPEQGLVEWMNSIGVRYGVELNAYTSHESTFYMVSLPQSDRAILEKLLLSIGDLIRGLTLSESAIQREQQIVKEEIRSWEQSDPFYDLKIGKGLHAHRMPLGTVEDIDQITQERIRDFYNKWYHPEYATLIMVGGVEPREVEKIIIDQIGKIKKREAETYGGNIDGLLYYPPEARYDYIWDDLITQHNIEYIIPHPSLKSDSFDGLYTKALQRMALAAWENRLFALPNIAVSDAWYLGKTDHLTLSVTATDTLELQKKISEATAALYSLSKTDAISPEELNDLIQQTKERYRQVHSQALPSLVDDYVDQATFGDYLLMDSVEERRFHETLEKITASDLLPFIRQYQELLLAPIALIAHTSPTPTPQESKIRATIERAIADGVNEDSYSFIYSKSKSKSEIPQEIPTPWIFTQPIPFNAEVIKEQHHYPQIKVTEVLFTNGIRLLLKPTSQSETVRINVLIPGGQASIPIGLETQLESLAAYMELGLLERVPREQLQPYLLQNDLALSLLPSTYWYELFASAPADRSGQLVRLLYEKMLYPEIPYKDMDEVRADLLEEVGQEKRLSKMIDRSPEMALERELSLLLGHHLPLKEAREKEEIEVLDIELMAEAHKDRCSRTMGTTIIVTGGFNREELIQALGALFGTLPLRKTLPIRQEIPSIWTATPEKLFKGTHGNVVTHLTTLYTNTYAPSLQSHLMLKVTHELLRTRLIDLLRMDKGIAYSPAVYLHYRSFPSPQATYQMEVATAPENSILAKNIISKIFQKLMSQPIEEGELEQIKETFLLNKAKALEQNDPTQWHKTLSEIVKNGESLSDFENYETVLRTITPTSLQHFHQAFFSNGVEHSYRIE